MELEPSSIDFKPVKDPRPHMPEPPPVWLVAVEDVLAPMPSGLEIEMDRFYIDMLKFEREPAAQWMLVYKAANGRLCLSVVEPPIARVDMRPIAIEVPSLTTIQSLLIDREIEFQWQRGLTAGQETLLLQDPGGNWVQLGEFHRV